VPQFYYEAFQVNVVETGCYNFISNNSIKTFYSIYKNNFNPSVATENLVLRNADICDNTQFRLITHLQSNITYILVVTTYHSYDTGTYSIVISGSNNVNLTYLSKHLDYFVNNSNSLQKYFSNQFPF